MTADGKTGVLLVEDHELLRAGLRALLEGDQDIEVLGETGSGAEAVALCAQLKPDVVLMDLRIPDMDGVEATRRITSSCRHSRVLALTMDSEEEVLLDIVDAGGSGYLRKSWVETRLLPALHAVAEGKTWFNQQLVTLLRARRQEGLAH